GRDPQPARRRAHGGGRGVDGVRPDRADEPRRLPRQVRARALDRHAPHRRPRDVHRPRPHRAATRRAVVGYRATRDRGDGAPAAAHQARDRVCPARDRARHAAHHVDLRPDHGPRARAPDPPGRAVRGRARPARRRVVPRWRHGRHPTLGRRPASGPGEGTVGRAAQAAVARGLVKAGRVLLAAAALVLLNPGAVHAADLRAAGWWWQAKSGALGAAPLTSPDVPDGGLLVAGAPDGATAIAALRYSLDASETPSQLTLKVATDTGGASAVLAACPAGSAWKPASPGAWEDKPAAACDRGSVNGIRSADGSAWTFAVAPLATGGTLDVVLVPGKVAGAPTGADGSTFQLAFDKPGSDSLTTTRSFSGTVPAPPLPPPLPAPAAGTPGA